MAEPKGWTKRNRAFINTPATDCMAAVGWYVKLEFWADREKGEKTGKYKANVDSSIDINREATHHYVSRKADLRALRNMRKELDAFEEACEQALMEAEEYNAAS